MSIITIPDLPRGYLSFSQIDAYLNCPKKYEWRYIIKPPIVSGSPALMIGSCGHEAIAEILKTKMNGKHININFIIKKYHDKLNKQLKNLVAELNVPIPISELLHQHDELLKVWVRDVLPEFAPTAVETKVETTIGGYPFLMYIDAIHKDRRVIDWKFTGSAKNKYHLANSLQLSIYSIGTGLDEVGFGSLVKPRAGKESNWKPRVSMIYTSRTPIERNWANNVVKSTGNAIRERRFPLCSPENFLCTDKYCDFFSICRGKGKTKEPSWLKEIASAW